MGVTRFSKLTVCNCYVCLTSRAGRGFYFVFTNVFTMLFVRILAVLRTMMTSILVTRGLESLLRAVTAQYCSSEGVNQEP